MDRTCDEDRLILQMIERLTRVETKIDSLMDTISKSNDKFLAIEGDINDLNQRLGKVEMKADRANVRMDDSKAMVIKIGTVTSTAIGVLINVLSLYLSHK